MADRLWNLLVPLLRLALWLRDRLRRNTDLPVLLLPALLLFALAWQPARLVIEFTCT